MTSHHNPWLSLAADNNRLSFILPKEQALIAKFNTKVSATYRVHENIFPAPFMGDVQTAPILILMLNPGYDEKEDTGGTNYYKTYESWWMQQIQHQLPFPDLPLFCVEEEYRKKSDYWYNKLMPLINATSAEKVAQKIAKVQFFPYHSIKYKALYKRLIKEEGFNSYLPSQEYNFELVRQAIERNAEIIIPRSKKFWYKAIPELEEYSHIHFTKNYRNPILSVKNLGVNSFNVICNKLHY
ncbi:hypothetical protein [Salegentibacter sp. Hel_I_6]|uniref:hypothetical protein n=1 Tax=Salegentibacter sp. Hel_I_6 TaxID=1250278 RepID=UPI00056CEFE8|nr:hypothetical protein [Salegentibacter sp. Hel_I_6]